MRNIFKIQLIAALLLLANITVANSWENYKNFSVTTDILYANGKTYITAKGGLMIEDNTTHQKTFLTKSNSNLPSNLLENILQVSGKADIFIGTYDNGLAIINNNQITSIQYPANFGLLYNMVEGPGSNIYLQSSNGAFQFNTTNNTFTQFNTTSNNVWLYNAWSFDFNTQQNLVVFTGTKFLIVNNTNFAVIDSSQEITDPIVTGCSPVAVTMHFLNDNSQLLNLGFGFCLLNKDGSVTPANSGLPTNLFNTQVYKTKDGNIFCMTDFSGIYQFDIATMAWIHLFDLSAAINPYKFIADKNNNIHVSDGGLLLNSFSHTGIATNSWNLKQYVFNSNNFATILIENSTTIKALSQDNIFTYNSNTNDWSFDRQIPSKYGVIYGAAKINNTLYANNYGKGMIYSDGQNWQWIPHFNTDTTYDVFDYDVAPNGDVYFVNTFGLMKYSNGSTTKILSTQQSNSSDWFTAVGYDIARNILWLSKPHKIIKYDFNNTTTYTAAQISELATASVQSITPQPNSDVIYFGCSNNTILFYDDANSFQSIAVPRNVGTQSDIVYKILFDNNKIIAALTDGTGGFYVYENGNWDYFSPATKPGLISNVIADIAIDQNGNYWLAHNDDNGVSVYKTAATGIETINTKEMMVYPNPCNRYLYVENTNNKYENLKLYSITGEELSPEIKVAADKIEINTSALSNGLYILKSKNASTKISVIR